MQRAGHEPNRKADASHAQSGGGKGRGVPASPGLLLVSDKVVHPQNPKRFHYRAYARTPAVAVAESANDSGNDNDNDNNAVGVENHVHVDVEATMRDTTEDIGKAHCNLEDGLGTFQRLSADAALPEGTKVVIAECANLGGKVMYGKVRMLSPAGAHGDGDADGGNGEGIAVDTRFESELDKARHAFTKYSMQHYAGPTPIHNSRHLSYLQELGVDPATRYDNLSRAYGRDDVAAQQLLRNGKGLRNPAGGGGNHHGYGGSGSGSGSGSDRARRLDSSTVDVGPTAIYNCEKVAANSGDAAARGCSQFSQETITVFEDLDFVYGSTNFETSLYCKDCALTLEGASLYASIDSDFGVDGDLDAIITDIVDDIVDDVGDAVGDTLDDVGDAVGDAVDDTVDWIDDYNPFRRNRRRAQDGIGVTAEVDFTFGGDVTGLAADFSLLLEIDITQSTGDRPENVELFSLLVPNLSIGGSTFGIDLAAGLRCVATVDPQVRMEGSIAAQAGAKLVFDGTFGFDGKVTLDGLDISNSVGSFSAVKMLDTPRLTVEVDGEYIMVYIFELQAGFWASISDATGASFYGAIGVPVVIEGTFAGSATSLLSSIPDDYCVAGGGVENHYFVGDCTQPNNLQAQTLVATKDVYGRVYAGASFGISGVSTQNLDWTQDVDQSTLSGYSLVYGPYTITYCDCILYNGVDCSVQGSGSQCAAESFPPASERVAPAYTENSPPSGMALAWEQEAIAPIDTAGLSAGAIAAIVICCLLVVTGIVLGVYYGVVRNKTSKHSTVKVKKIAQKYGAQVKTANTKK